MILDFCIWLEDGFVGSLVNDSLYAFAVIESIHLVRKRGGKSGEWQRSDDPLGQPRGQRSSDPLEPPG